MAMDTHATRPRSHARRCGHPRPPLWERRYLSDVCRGVTGVTDRRILWVLPVAVSPLVHGSARRGQELCANARAHAASVRCLLGSGHWRLVTSAI
jgi:hypothetical protein